MSWLPRSRGSARRTRSCAKRRAVWPRIQPLSRRSPDASSASSSPARRSSSSAVSRRRRDKRARPRLRRPRRAGTSGASRLGFLLPRANSVAVADGDDEHTAIADLPGSSRLDDGLDSLFSHRVGHDQLDLHLWQQTDVVLLTAVDGGVNILLVVAEELGHWHPGYVPCLL